ncbi:hypothetical protein N7520_005448 [Penicillium odoratum]|uniref:uncharacterized protein n=1 Tax=Penicillium odoratum TaxID=1167516 RepID=UPI002549BC88|nr:uncharacterized protein N7520_005448 [Penicillium odoratum]KAJ5765889.1 hypothetical protein N7520_005448 [Penicillium odoratum]
MFRRTSDFFKQYNQRRGSVDLTKSVQSEPSDNTGVDNTPKATIKDAPQKQHSWSFYSLDENEPEKRRLKREERERADWVATRQYCSAQRRSNGVGIGF